MSWTADDLAHVEEAIATGARKVRYADGRETEFRSLAEMQSTRALIARSLGLSLDRGPRAVVLEHRR